MSFVYAASMWIVSAFSSVLSRCNVFNNGVSEVEKGRVRKTVERTQPKTHLLTDGNDSHQNKTHLVTDQRATRSRSQSFG